MADEIELQAQAASEPGPTTAAETTATAAAPAAETNANLNHQQNSAAAEVDVDGMDAKAYAEAKERFGRGEINLEAEAPETTPEPKQETPATTTETQPTETKEDDDDELEGELAPKRIRLTDLDERERLAVKLVRDMKKANTPISFTEAEKRVAALYGDTEEKTNQPTEEPASPTDIETQITQLRADYKEAAANVDTVKMAEIQDQIESARDRLATARATERSAQDAELTALNEVKAQLREDYPDFAKKDSALSKRWTEVHARLVAKNHPILENAAEATEYITLVSARELGILPVAKTAKASPSIPATSPKGLPPVQPASGASRTTAPSNTTGQQIEKQIDAVSTLDEYQRLKDNLLNPASQAA